MESKKVNYSSGTQDYGDNALGNLIHTARIESNGKELCGIVLKLSPEDIQQLRENEGHLRINHLGEKGEPFPYLLFYMNRNFDENGEEIPSIDLTQDGETESDDEQSSIEVNELNKEVKEVGENKEEIEDWQKIVQFVARENHVIRDLIRKEATEIKDSDTLKQIDFEIGTISEKIVTLSKQFKAGLKENSEKSYQELSEISGKIKDINANLSTFHDDLSEELAEQLKELDEKIGTITGKKGPNKVYINLNNGGG